MSVCFNCGGGVVLDSNWGFLVDDGGNVYGVVCAECEGEM